MATNPSTNLPGLGATCFPPEDMQKNVYVVGVCGPKNGGKSTFAAEFLRVVRGRDRVTAKEISLAARMKDDVSSLLSGQVGDALTGTSALRESGLPCRFEGLGDAQTYRRLLQRYGQLMRELDPWWWVRYLHNAVMAKRWLPVPLIIVVPDVRFPNEVEYIGRWANRALVWTGSMIAGQADPDESEQFSNYGRLVAVAGAAGCPVTASDKDTDTLDALRAIAARLAADVLRTMKVS